MIEFNNDKLNSKGERIPESDKEPYKCLSCPKTITSGDYCSECSDTPDGTKPDESIKLGQHQTIHGIGEDFEGAELSIKSDEKPIDKAKKELADFNKIILEVWDDDLTDKQELLFLKFYKAGIESRDEEIERMKCCWNCGRDEICSPNENDVCDKWKPTILPIP